MRVADAARQASRQPAPAIMSTLVIQLPARARLQGGAEAGARRRRRLALRARRPGLRAHARRAGGVAARARRAGAAAQGRHGGAGAGRHRCQLAPHHRAQGARRHGCVRPSPACSKNNCSTIPPRCTWRWRPVPMAASPPGSRRSTRPGSPASCARWRRPACRSNARCRSRGPKTRRWATSRRAFGADAGAPMQLTWSDANGVAAIGVQGALARQMLPIWAKQPARWTRAPGGRRAGRALAGLERARAERRGAHAAGRALAVEPAPVRPRRAPPRHPRAAQCLAALSRHRVATGALRAGRAGGTAGAGAQPVGLAPARPDRGPARGHDAAAARDASRGSHRARRAGADAARDRSLAHRRRQERRHRPRDPARRRGRWPGPRASRRWRA